MRRPLRIIGALVVIACTAERAPAERASNADSSAGPTGSPRAAPAAAAARRPASDTPCPEPGVAPDDDRATSRPPHVPLVVGLTLANSWVRAAAEGDRECLVQVTEVSAASVTVTHSCPLRDAQQAAAGQARGGETHSRRLCRADLRDAYTLHTKTSLRLPTVIGGATMFSLSARSLRELRSGGVTRHRFFQLAERWADGAPVTEDSDGSLRATGRGTSTVIVNGRPVALPVIELSGQVGPTTTTATVLDDEQLPLLLRYAVPADGFSIQYRTISFPTGRQIETALEAEKRVDVYGIYFDVASDALRPESEPVLREIASALAGNPTWVLRIQGHTDNAGGAAMNLDLSRRRSEAVRRALVDRFAVGPARLTTAGVGTSQPKASNDTPEGRALNRRVELVRHEPGNAP